MNYSPNSFSNLFTLKKKTSTIEPSSDDKYNNYLTYSRYDNNNNINNNIYNSADYFIHKDFHSPKKFKRIHSTYGTDILKNKKYTSKYNNNSREINDEEIMMIIESIESVKNNQKEILSIIKELKSDKRANINKNNKTNINKEKKEEANENKKINELINSFTLFYIKIF